ncbi:hypothetical protein B0J13DRAFT_533911 [Dactylonectria estremocensis]|uniref:GATA-type domain-containing protein n=1 Tax=Dactylonectria estremocensis TaxID=1079267 RepID=A0A9P9D5I9_9HYPO|nr:hypothetical protein B0J13DRAFT_533911 [Dactylonectria estremocensis]
MEWSLAWDKGQLSRDAHNTTRMDHIRQRSIGSFIETTLYPGDAAEGETPSFLLAQTKLIKASSGDSTKSITSGLQEASKVSQPAGGSTTLRAQHTASDDVFDELSTTKCSSWQLEVRKMEKTNRILAEELQSLLKRRKSTEKKNVVRKCANCHTRTTPEWQRGPSGQRDLCNSCGLRWAKQELNPSKGPSGRLRVGVRATTPPAKPDFTSIQREFAI